MSFFYTYSKHTTMNELSYECFLNRFLTQNTYIILKYVITLKIKVNEKLIKKISVNIYTDCSAKAWHESTGRFFLSNRRNIQKTLVILIRCDYYNIFLPL